MTSLPLTRSSRGFALLLLCCFVLTSCYANVPRAPASLEGGLEGVTGVVLHDGTRVAFPDEGELLLEEGDLLVVQEGPRRYGSDGDMLPGERRVDRYESEEIRDVIHAEFRFFQTVGMAGVAGVVILGGILGVECIGGCFDSLVR